MSEGKQTRIQQAFLEIKRRDFLPLEKKELATLDRALPIGYDQTISQPSVVYFMLRLLEPSVGNKVLDVGSGSGWTTALLAWIVGPSGKVMAMEIIPALKKMGEKNVAQYNFVEKGIASFILGDGSKGCSSEAPFDRILVSASASEIPPALKKQLKIGGKMVIPIEENLNLVEKKGENDFQVTAYPGFVFVPLKNNS
jgi:protein-L-isoaspartate(D-aspartate) O-methyltransferase